jgi:hypothetical protein
VPARDQRRAFGDRGRQRARLGLDAIVGHDAIDQALLPRRLGAEQAAIEQDFERVGRAD